MPLTPQGCVVAEANAIAPSRATALASLLAHVVGCTDKLQATDKHDVMQFRYYPYRLKPYRLAAKRKIRRWA